jgi:folylpolyglutamate synthase/dihydropteroate synthase
LQLAAESAAGGVVVVAGSVYLVGEARSLLGSEFGGIK